MVSNLVTIATKYFLFLKLVSISWFSCSVSNRLTGLNNWLEKSVKTLEEELKNSRNDFETLDTGAET